METIVSRLGMKAKPKSSVVWIFILNLQQLSLMGKRKIMFLFHHYVTTSTCKNLWPLLKTNKCCFDIIYFFQLLTIFFRSNKKNVVCPRCIHLFYKVAKYGA